MSNGILAQDGELLKARRPVSHLTSNALSEIEKPKLPNFLFRTYSYSKLCHLFLFTRAS